MRSRSALCAALATGAALLVGCGGDEPPAPAQKAPSLPGAATIDKDPSAIACGHVRDQQQWADVTRRATVAVADRARLEGMSRLQATQSLFYAMTELCKERPATYQPADAAVRAVEQGRFAADLGAP
jgi:hypothetical protein